MRRYANPNVAPVSREMLEAIYGPLKAIVEPVRKSGLTRDMQFFLDNYETYVDPKVEFRGVDDYRFDLVRRNLYREFGRYIYRVDNPPKRRGGKAAKLASKLAAVQARLEAELTELADLHKYPFDPRFEDWSAYWEGWQGGGFVGYVAQQTPDGRWHLVGYASPDQADEDPIERAREEAIAAARKDDLDRWEFLLINHPETERPSLTQRDEADLIFKALREGRADISTIRALYGRGHPTVMYLANVGAFPRWRVSKVSPYDIRKALRRLDDAALVRLLADNSMHRTNYTSDHPLFGEFVELYAAILSNGRYRFAFPTAHANAGIYEVVIAWAILQGIDRDSEDFIYSIQAAKKNIVIAASPAYSSAIDRLRVRILFDYLIRGVGPDEFPIRSGLRSFVETPQTAKWREVEEAAERLLLANP